MKSFFEEIGEKIEQALEKEVKKILKKIGKEKIYSAALVTDSDCITLFLAVNTYEYMKKEDARFLKGNADWFSKEEIEQIKKGSINLSKWIPDEWGYSDGKNSGLVEISKLLFEKEAADSQEYEKHKDLFLETVTSAFQHVIEANVFGENSDEITYFISMSDDERTSDIEDDSAKLLNLKIVYEKYHEEILRDNEFWEKKCNDH